MRRNRDEHLLIWLALADTLTVSARVEFQTDRQTEVTHDEKEKIRKM